MRSAHITATGILNAAAHLTLRAATPWMGVLWITALPLRLLQLYFVNQMALLEAPQYYGNYLWRLALLVFAAFLVSLFGRAVFVRACYFARNSDRDVKLEPLKVPLSDFIPYVYTALINEFCFYLTLFTFVMWPLFFIYGALAAATSYGIGGPKLFGAPWTALKSGMQWKALFSISIFFAFALVLAIINLYVLCLLALTLFGPLLGADLPRWQYIFEANTMGVWPKQPLTHGLLLIGASLIVEPFWLAANVDLVQKARARKSGEDLQLWFRNIKSEAAQ